MSTLLDLFKTESAGNGALRVRDWRVNCPERVERPDNIQFSGVFRRGIAKCKDF
jgi:hypothetical protein